MKLRLEIDVTKDHLFVQHYADNGDYLGTVGMAHPPTTEDIETCLRLDDNTYLNFVHTPYNRYMHPRPLTDARPLSQPKGRDADKGGNFSKG